MGAIVGGAWTGPNAGAAVSTAVAGLGVGGNSSFGATVAFTGVARVVGLVSGAESGETIGVMVTAPLGAASGGVNGVETGEAVPSGEEVGDKSAAGALVDCRLLVDGELGDRELSGVLDDCGLNGAIGTAGRAEMGDAAGVAVPTALGVPMGANVATAVLLGTKLGGVGLVTGAVGDVIGLLD
jgi:hypothetical protein